MFDFSQTEGIKQHFPETLGAAGFRVHTAINTPSYLDEFLVFLGATYFRAVSKGQNYGLSARGLAVNTAQPEGEEFPWFREFWIQTPGKKDKELTLFALLDSESLTGAFAFKVTPGSETIVDVSSRIFPRKPVQTLGVAPLTSMFFYGENSSPGRRMDWRPEVHDSDGLLVHFRSGEWLWRPNQNPNYLLVNSFDADRVRGFGLLQRDTDFNNYQDLESRYENRPSVWVEPLEDWGGGSVERVLIPSEDEIHDNVVAFWNPKEKVEPGKPMSFAYRMRWFKPPGSLPPSIRVTATRVSKSSANERLFVLDFAGGTLPKLKADARADGVVSIGPGAKLAEQASYKNVVTGGWRLAFKVIMDVGPVLENIKPDTRKPVELRAFLKLGDGSVSETWSYAITPDK
jgi:glucans biosynthesis protein